MTPRYVEPTPDEPRRTIIVRQWCPYGHGFLGEDADELACAECKRQANADLARAAVKAAVAARRGLLVLAGLAAAGAIFATLGDDAFAAPAPNAAAPLAWPTRSVEAAAHRWLRELAPDALGDGVRLVTDKWACSQTRRRPARYRCEGAVLWVEAGEYVETREVLARCRPSRRVGGNGATWTTARVLVRREGPRRGGLLCGRVST